GWAGGGGDERVEVVFFHDGVDAFGAREAVALGECVEVFLVGERAFFVGGQKSFLAEVLQLLAVVAVVEGGGVFQVFDGGVRAAVGQVGGHIGLELVAEDRRFGGAGSVDRDQLFRFDECGAGFF